MATATKTRQASFTVNRGTLLDAVNAVMPATGGISPIMKGLLVETDQGKMTLTASNGTEVVTETIKVKGKSKVQTVLPASRLATIVKACSTEDVELVIEPNGATVVSAKFSAKVKTLHAGDFITFHATGEATRVNAIQFVQAIGRGSYAAAATSDGRPILQAVHMTVVDEALALDSTDSYRLARARTTLPDLGDHLVPLTTLAMVARNFRHAGEPDEIGIVIDDRLITFELGTMTVTGALTEGEFPNVAPMLANPVKDTLVFDRADMIGALRRSMVMAGASDPVRLVVTKPGQVSIEVVNEDEESSVEPLECETTAEGTVAFRPAYLLAALERMDDDELVMHFDPEGDKPAFLASADRAVQALLMPIRLPK